MGESISYVKFSHFNKPVWFSLEYVKSQFCVCALSSVTVVAHYNLFWVKLPGPIIYLHGVTPHPTLPTSTPPPIQTTTPSILPGPVSVTVQTAVINGCDQ